VITPRLRIAALAAVPMLAGAAGAVLDERRHAGFSQWRSACRAAGLSLTSLASFTWQLLPMALALTLAGGLFVQSFALWNRSGAHACLAAHAGCALAMPIALLLCALALPLAVTVVAEWLLAAALGLALATALSRARPLHP
jgi:hypothetical protein